MYSSLGLSLLTSALWTSVSLAAPTAPTARGPAVPLYQVGVTSFDGTQRYNGQPLSACHIGAAMSVLCLHPNQSSYFTWAPVVEGTTNPAYLQYALTDTIEQSLSFVTSGSGADSGVQYAGFAPTNPAVELEFVPTRSLLEVYSNSTLSSAGWYMCPYNYGGEILSALAASENTPTDPDCAPVWFFRE